MTSTSAAGINLKRLAGHGDHTLLEFTALALWLHTCGLPPLHTSSFQYVSPAAGFAPFLKKFPEFYSELEAVFKTTLKAWSPKPVPALQWLNPKKRNIKLYILKNGKTHFAASATATADGVLLDHRVTPGAPPEHLRRELPPNHPLLVLTAGFHRLPALGIPTEKIAEIKNTSDQLWQIETSSTLWQAVTKATGNPF